MNFDVNESLDQARERNVRDALREDIGTGDWTGLLVPADRWVQAQVKVRESAVLCGQAWFDACVMALDPEARVQWHHVEGADVVPDSVVCTLRPGRGRC